MSYNPFSLQGKTILVTGASSGIGRQVAIECSRMGANLVIVARNEERLKETFNSLEANPEHKIIIADLCKEEDLTNLISKIDSLDGVVLCAGVGNSALVKFATRAKFDQVFNTNFFSTVELLRLLFKNKKIKNGGSVVLLDSIGGVEIYPYGNMIYGTSKAALNSYAKFAAMELSPRMIRVNCVCPGMVDTPMIHDGAISEEEMQKDMKYYPLKRYGKVTDVAYGVIYLLSDASSWVTGQDLIIDGGISRKYVESLN